MVESGPASSFNFQSMLANAEASEGTKEEIQAMIQECVQPTPVEVKGHDEPWRDTKGHPIQYTPGQDYKGSKEYEARAKVPWVAKARDPWKCGAVLASCIEESRTDTKLSDNELRLRQENEADRRVADAIVDMLSRKNANYGRNLPRHGLKGVTIRLMDKVQRLENLVLGNVQNEVSETVEDTMLDIGGYVIKTLALLYLEDMTMEGNWKEANGLEGFHHKYKA